MSNVDAIAKIGEKPAFLAEQEKEGVEQLTEFLLPSQLKIVQKNSSDALLAAGSAGDIILLPELLVMGGKEEPCLCVPVYFYPEWVHWNARELKSEKAILGRTLDPSDEIAVKAKEQIEEPIEGRVDSDGKPLYSKYVEHLNFLVMLFHDQAPTLPVIVSFSSAEHRTGRIWSNLIAARDAAIFAGKYELSIGPRQNAKGAWYGFDIANAGWISDEEDYRNLQTLHNELKTKEIEANYEPEPGQQEGQEASNSTSTQF